MKLAQLLMASTGQVLAITLTLVGLKLAGVLRLSWWSVTAPVWFAWLVVALMAFCLLFHLGLTRIERLSWLRK